MIKRIQFSIAYALHNIVRDRQRTAFALFSIAAGVATVVALRMLGIMLTDALTSNAQALMRGDIAVTTANSGPHVSIVPSGNNGPRVYPFTANNTPSFDQWAAQHHADITYAVTSELMQTALVQGDQPGTPAFALGYFIDPKVYPFYNIVRAEDPSGASLAQLLNGPNRVVLGRRLANQLGVHVGDTMRVGSAKDLQTVVGIVPEASEANFNSFMNVIFGFVYVDSAYMPQFGLPAGSADTAYIRLPDGQDPQAVAAEISADWARPASSRWRVDNVTRLLKTNTVTADLISRFVLLLSLIALVIGGVGIVNTLLVSVNRRSAEIAVLKTLGLQGGSVGLLFLSEAIILGFVGSLIGLGLGLLLSLFARDLGQQAFAVILPWRFSLEPLALGLGLGMFITVLFSLLPTFMAAQVRPSLVLRQGNIPLARAGCLPALISLAVLLAGVSSISESIIGSARNVLPRVFANLPYGLIGTLAVFFLIMVMLALVWLVVWFLGHLPNFRNPNLRIAVRSLSLHRGRTSLSLLALIIGMTALSGTLIMTRSISLLLETSLTEPLGGNVIILPLLSFSTAGIQSTLDNAPGVEGYRDVQLFQGDLVAVDGDRNFVAKLSDSSDVNAQIIAGQLNLILGVDVHGNLARGTLAAGRYLNASDAGMAHLVIPNRPELSALGVHVGSKFTYLINGQERVFEVVGLVDPDPRLGLIPFSLGDSAIQAPLNTAKSTIPFDIMIATVKPDAINSVMASVGSPDVFVFDLSIFDSIISRLLSQLAALPLLVAGLSLFAATVLIATTVSLATMERRRQIAILKAIGVTRRQALTQLLTENAIVGAAGGLISLLPTFIILAAVPALTQNFVQLPVPVDLILLMLALSIGITLVATLLTAWTASSEKPLEALRYE